MIYHNLFRGSEVRVAMAHVAAGTSVQTGSSIDTFGYDGVAFVFLYGALTATQVTSAKLQGGNASNGSDAADLAYSQTANLADGNSDTVQVIDVYRPMQRYITPVVNRGTANTEILGVLAILYHGHNMPATVLDASVATAPLFLANPQPGTATATNPNGY